MTMQKIVPMRINMTLMILLSMMRNWYVCFFQAFELQVSCFSNVKFKLCLCESLLLFCSRLGELLSRYDGC